MISLKESIVESQYYNKVNEELSLLISEEIINESFKSSLLSKLAKAIWDAEAYNREKNNNNNRQTSFASIFGPEKNKYGKLLTGIKWTDITDDDFEKFDGTDKKLHKMIRDAYANKLNANFIICDKKTEDIVYFIKGYCKTEKAVNGMGITKTVIFYQFRGSSYDTGVQARKVAAYKYRERFVNANEAIDIVKKYDVYVLEVTSDMIKKYSEFNDFRSEQKKGMINYDKSSLEEYARKQKARYNVLVKEMKAKRLIAGQKELWEKIKKINDECIKLYEKIMGNPEYIDKFYSLSNLMDYVARAYEYYYKFIQQNRENDRRKIKLKERGKTDEEIENMSSWMGDSSKENIRDVEEYLNRIQNEIKRIEEELKEGA